MTINSIITRVTPVGNGISTVFAFPYLFLANSDLKVYQNGVLLAAGYTVTGALNPAGGSVTFATAPAVADQIIILRDPPLTQLLDLVNNDALPAEPVEQGLDRRAMIEQRLSERINRTIRIPDVDVTGLMAELPTVANRANKFLYFDAAGNPTATAQIVAGTLFFAPTTQTFNGTGAQTVFSLTTPPGNADAVIVRISGVLQTPTIDYTVTSNSITFGTAPAAGTNNVVVQNFGVAGLVPVVTATSVTYVAAGTGAVARTIESHMRDFPHIKDYGAICNGAIDDTAAINLALSANFNRTLYANGTPLISSTIILDGRQKLVFEGGPDAGDSAPPATYFIKKSTMNTVGVILGFGAFWEGGGIKCGTGDTGGGVQLRGNSAGMRNVTVFGSSLSAVSGVGVRVGDDIGTNTNSWLLDNVNVSAMGSHGFYIHDGGGGAPNTNAGTMIHCESLVNTGDGIKLQNTSGNMILGCLSESNIGVGARISAPANFNTIFGGDYEANGGNQVLIEVGSSNTTTGGIDTGAITDFSTNGSVRLDYQYQKVNSFTPVLVGSTVAGVHTYTTQTGWYVRFGAFVYIFIDILLSVKDAAMAGNANITGLPFTLPAGYTNGITVMPCRWGNITFPANYTAMYAEVFPSETQIRLTRSGSGQAGAFVAAGEISSSTQLLISGIYPILKL